MQRYVYIKANTQFPSQNYVIQSNFNLIHEMVIKLTISCCNAVYPHDVESIKSYVKNNAIGRDDDTSLRSNAFLRDAILDFCLVN